MTALTAFGSVDATALRWVRTAPGRHAFELKVGDATVATLEWAAAFGSLATARTADATLSLKRGGFLHPHVTVRDGAGQDVGRLAMHVRSGLLDLPGRPSYRLRSAGLLVPAWQFLDDQGRPVLHLEPVAEGGRLQGALLQVEASLAKSPDLPMLAILAWYLVVLAWFEDETIRTSESALAALS